MQSKIAASIFYFYIFTNTSCLIWSNKQIPKSTFHFFSVSSTKSRSNFQIERKLDKLKQLILSSLLTNHSRVLVNTDFEGSLSSTIWAKLVCKIFLYWNTYLFLFFLSFLFLAMCIYKWKLSLTLCGSISVTISLWPIMRNPSCLPPLLFSAIWLLCATAFANEERKIKLQMGQVSTGRIYSVFFPLLLLYLKKMSLGIFKSCLKASFQRMGIVSVST